MAERERGRCLRCSEVVAAERRAGTALVRDDSAETVVSIAVFSESCCCEACQGYEG